VVSFMPWPLYPLGKFAGTHWLGGWMGLTTGLDAVEKRKNPVTVSAGNRIPIVQPIA